LPIQITALTVKRKINIMKKHPFPINRTLIIFFIIALVWIIVTDYVVLHFAPNIRDYHNQILVKEILFVVIVTTVIYFIIRRNHTFLNKGMIP